MPFNPLCGAVFLGLFCAFFLWVLYCEEDTKYIRKKLDSEDLSNLAKSKLISERQKKNRLINSIRLASLILSVIALCLVALNWMSCPVELKTVPFLILSFTVFLEGRGLTSPDFVPDSTELNDNLFANIPFPTSAEVLKGLHDQHKSFVTASDLFVTRRQTLHSFFTAAIGALLAASATILSRSDDPTQNQLLLWMFCFLGAVLSLCWLSLFRHYDDLSRAKHKIAKCFEERLGLVLTANTQTDLMIEGVSFTSIEQLLPFVFFVFCFLLGTLSVFSKSEAPSGINIKISSSVTTIIADEKQKWQTTTMSSAHSGIQFFGLISGSDATT